MNSSRSSASPTKQDSATTVVSNSADDKKESKQEERLGDLEVLMHKDQLTKTQDKVLASVLEDYSDQIKKLWEEFEELGKMKQLKESKKEIQKIQKKIQITMRNINKLNPEEITARKLLIEQIKVLVKQETHARSLTKKISQLSEQIRKMIDRYNKIDRNLVKNYKMHWATQFHGYTSDFISEDLHRREEGFSRNNNARVLNTLADMIHVVSKDEKIVPSKYKNVIQRMESSFKNRIQDSKEVTKKKIKDLLQGNKDITIKHNFKEHACYSQIYLEDDYLVITHCNRGIGKQVDNNLVYRINKNKISDASVMDIICYIADLKVESYKKGEKNNSFSFYENLNLFLVKYSFQYKKGVDVNPLQENNCAIGNVKGLIKQRLDRDSYKKLTTAIRKKSHADYLIQPMIEKLKNLSRKNYVSIDSSDNFLELRQLIHFIQIKSMRAIINNFSGNTRKAQSIIHALKIVDAYQAAIKNSEKLEPRNIAEIDKYINENLCSYRKIFRKHELPNRNELSEVIISQLKKIPLNKDFINHVLDDLIIHNDKDTLTNIYEMINSTKDVGIIKKLFECIVNIVEYLENSFFVDHIWLSKHISKVFDLIGSPSGNIKSYLSLCFYHKLIIEKIITFDMIKNDSTGWRHALSTAYEEYSGIKLSGSENMIETIRNFFTTDPNPTMPVLTTAAPAAGSSISTTALLLSPQNPGGLISSTSITTTVPTTAVVSAATEVPATVSATTVVASTVPALTTVASVTVPTTTPASTPTKEEEDQKEILQFLSQFGWVSFNKEHKGYCFASRRGDLSFPDQSWYTGAEGSLILLYKTNHDNVRRINDKLVSIDEALVAAREPRKHLLQR